MCRSRIFAACVILIFALGSSAQETKQLSGASGMLGSNGPQDVTANQLRAPAKARSAVEKAREAMFQGKTDEAYKQVSRALGAYPHYAIALTIRGLLSFEAGKDSEASADFEDAVQTDPEYGPPYVLLGALYNHARRYDDALLVLTKGLRLVPSAWQAHFQMGQALFGKRDDVSALREITDTARMITDAEAPEDRALVHFWRAHVLVQLKDFSAAKPEYEQAIKEQPDGPLASYARQVLAVLPSLETRTAAESAKVAEQAAQSDH